MYPGHPPDECKSLLNGALAARVGSGPTGLPNTCVSSTPTPQGKEEQTPEICRVGEGSHPGDMLMPADQPHMQHVAKHLSPRCCLHICQQDVSLSASGSPRD